MVIRRKKAEVKAPVETPRGFDAFDLRLGDMMRGERATLGKSLLDVERDIRIRASYIAAIENADPEAFDTPGFIPGYVRSYARYLGLNPDEAFEKFCAECGFAVAHGMSAGASSIRKPDEPTKKSSRSKDPLVEPTTPFAPARESIFSGIEPGALGSAAVLVALISMIGFGGWTVLNEIQRVQFAPVENTPDVLTNLDPLDGVVVAGDLSVGTEDPVALTAAPFASAEDGIDRLYRPEALDVPVMIARDGPISTLNPSEVGTLRPQLADTTLDPVEAAVASVIARNETTATPRVVADPKPGVRVVAVRPAWVRVRAADGSVVFEGILNRGEAYSVPNTEEPPTLRVGESGAVYFEVAGQHYGPAGDKGSVTSGLALGADILTERYEVADVTRDEDLFSYVAELDASQSQE